MKGTNMDLEASAQANLKGGSGTNVEASGNVVVKGAMINLN